MSKLTNLILGLSSDPPKSTSKFSIIPTRIKGTGNFFVNEDDLRNVQAVKEQTSKLADRENKCKCK